MGDRKGISKKDGYLLGLREKWQGAFIFEGGRRANHLVRRIRYFWYATQNHQKHPEIPETGGNGQKQSLLLFRLILITCKPVKNNGILNKLKA